MAAMPSNGPEGDFFRIKKITEDCSDIKTKMSAAAVHCNYFQFNVVKAKLYHMINIIPQFSSMITDNKLQISKIYPTNT